MTTFVTVSETCFICGTTSDYTAISSTNRFGSADLDLRPPQMERSTISVWIRRCPGCGYCAPSVAEGPDEAGEVIRTEAYQEQATAALYPELANTFLCYALIQEAVQVYDRAGRAALHAAWVCDDTQGPAEPCRQRALDLFGRAQAEGQRLAQDTATEQALLADLLRRSGQFDQVLAACERGLAEHPPEILQQVLRYQTALALRQDNACYTIAEAVASEEP